MPPVRPSRAHRDFSHSRKQRTQSCHRVLVGCVCVGPARYPQGHTRANQDRTSVTSCPGRTNAKHAGATSRTRCQSVTERWSALMQSDTHAGKSRRLPGVRSPTSSSTEQRVTKVTTGFAARDRHVLRQHTLTTSPSRHRETARTHAPSRDCRTAVARRAVTHASSPAFHGKAPQAVTATARIVCTRRRGASCDGLPADAAAYLATTPSHQRCPKQREPVGWSLEATTHIAEYGRRPSRLRCEMHQRLLLAIASAHASTDARRRAVDA